MPTRTQRRAKRKARAVRPAMSVDPAGDWRQHTDMIPRDCTVLGTVTIGADTGALARLHATGSFVRVTDGQVHVLQQAKVRFLLENLARQSGGIAMVPVEEWQKG